MNYEKPRYRWNTAQGKFIIMSSELTKTESGEVPSWMKAKNKGASIGNIDASDLKPPKLKLLAGMSPEVTQGVPQAVPGNFWITILNMNLGQEVIITPVIVRKSYHVWAPKGPDQKGPLATSTDGIHWDQPNQVFDVRFPSNPNIYKWKIGKLVTDFGVNKFGTQQPEDKNSKPIATLTYDILVIVELPTGKKQLAVWTAARTGVGPTQNFISTIAALGIDQYYQRYRIVTQKKQGPSGDMYFTFDYQYVGNIQSEAEGDQAEAIFKQYAKSGFVVDINAEADDIAASKPASSQAQPRDASVDEDIIPF